eukprot:SAG31_NODE_10969_length_1077_cov_1.757669_2_plen_80_part_01
MEHAIDTCGSAIYSTTIWIESVGSHRIFPEVFLHCTMPSLTEVLPEHFKLLTVDVRRITSPVAHWPVASVNQSVFSKGSP